MVMRNRHDQAGGRDDLPARFRDRLAELPARPVGELILNDPPPAGGPPVGSALADGLAVAAAFLAVGAAHVLFLLVALAFLAGEPFTVPAP